MERKEMIKRLSEHLGVKAKYLSTPSFAYEIRTADEVYTIDKNCNITNQDGMAVSMEEILMIKNADGLVEGPKENETEENEAVLPEADIEVNKEESQRDVLMALDGFELKLDMGDHTGISLKNIINMLYSKQHLIGMAFQTDQHFIDESFVEGLNHENTEDFAGLEAAIQKLGTERCPGFEIDFVEKTFSFWLLGAQLTPEKIAAFKDLCVLIGEYAKTLKRASFKQAQEDNPKYALRTWLIRIGMNGPAYKETRLTLLKHLEGSGAFRTPSDEYEA